MRTARTAATPSNSCGVYALTSAAQFPLHHVGQPRTSPCRPTSWCQPPKQIGQSQQVGHAKQASPVGQRQEWIRLHDARPRGGDRPQPALLVVKTHPILAPRLVPRDQFDLPAALRVEGMGYANNSLPFLLIPCS